MREGRWGIVPGKMPCLAPKCPGAWYDFTLSPTLALSIPRKVHVAHDGLVLMNSVYAWRKTQNQMYQRRHADINYRTPEAYYSFRVRCCKKSSPHSSCEGRPQNSGIGEGGHLNRKSEKVSGSGKDPAKHHSKRANGLMPIQRLLSGDPYEATATRTRPRKKSPKL